MMNYGPKFKIVEINNVASLRTGHIIAQTPAYVDGEGAKVTATVFGEDKFVENGLIVGYDATGVLANYNAEKHSRPCLIYTEELTGDDFLELDQFAELVPGKNKPVYPRALPLNLGDTFTTNNVVAIEAGKPFAKINVDGRLELEKDRSADTMFIAKVSDLPAGQKAVEFTYIGLALRPYTGPITFTVQGVEYQANAGMTWWEWCNSEYNTSLDTDRPIQCEMGETGFVYRRGSCIETSEEKVADRTLQDATMVIKNGVAYIVVER